MLTSTLHQIINQSNFYETFEKKVYAFDASNVDN
jgi:hypothetical protein